MTPFTDDDLKKLKDAMIRQGPSMAVCYEGVKVESHDIDALIVRLEAAEKAVNRIDVGGFQLGGALIEWRKSRGE